MQQFLSGDVEVDVCGRTVADVDGSHRGVLLDDRYRGVTASIMRLKNHLCFVASEEALALVIRKHAKTCRLPLTTLMIRLFD